MDTFDVGAATSDELEAENRRLMEARGEAERGFKAEQAAIQAELDRRAMTSKLDALGGLTDDQRVAILDILKGE